MPKISLECQYCGDRWVAAVYSIEYLPECKKCKSSDYIAYKPFEEKDTNTYGYPKSKFE
jgi:ribosomal protein L33